MSEDPVPYGKEQSETPMKAELKQSGNRHARRLIKKLSEGGYNLPELVHDSIRQEFEYATLDGFRITMKHKTEKEMEDEENESRFDR